MFLKGVKGKLRTWVTQLKQFLHSTQLLIGAGDVERGPWRLDVLIHICTMLSKRLNAFWVTYTGRPESSQWEVLERTLLPLDISENNTAAQFLLYLAQLSWQHCAFGSDRLNWISKDYPCGEDGPLTCSCSHVDRRAGVGGPHGSRSTLKEQRYTGHMAPAASLW